VAILLAAIVWASSGLLPVLAEVARRLVEWTWPGRSRWSASERPLILWRHQLPS